MSASADLALLAGPEARDLLAAAVASSGGELVSWSVRQVDHRPGRSTTAAYRARVRWGDLEQTETLGASLGLDTVDSTPAGVLALSDGVREVAVWRFPLDPGLPALPTATSAPAMGALLTALGVAGMPPDGSGIATRVRAYRPRRRAVVEVTAPGARLFVKVLRPAKVEELHRRHVLLAAAGLPVPRSLGWTDEGLLVLQPLRGEPMRSALWTPAAALPSVEEVTALLDRLPSGVMDLPHRPAWTAGASHYAGVIGAALPAEASRAGQLAQAIARLTDGAPPVDPTHGDLYEAQLLLRAGRVTGLLDVDTAGPGRRADDLACLVGHLEILASLSAEHHDRLAALARSWAAEMEQAVAPDELRARVAGVVLSLATGPHRVQEAGWERATSRRLDLVEEWVAAAERVRA